MVVAMIGGGGLGVQLFQYASAFALAKRHNTPLVLYPRTDDSHVTSYNWGYRLSCYSIQARVVDEDFVSHFLDPVPWFRSFQRLLPLHRRRRVSWTSLQYDHHFPFYSKNVLLEGVRSGWRYLEGCSKELLETISLLKPLSAKNREWVTRIQNTNSVSVHVRRGDYLLSGVHAQLGEDYFKSALQKMASQVEKPEFFFFSDDIIWCRSTFRDVGYQLHFVENNNTNEPEFDLYLMSQCRNNIISNSTFSWWGAYLNRNRGKIVYRPRTFLAPEKAPVEAQHLEDLYPPQWQSLD